MIEEMLFWNIRSINTQKYFERLMEINRRHHYPFIALMEPFQEPSQIGEYNKRMRFDNVTVNYSGKI